MRRLRELRGLSLQGLADAVDMSKAHIWELERAPDRLGNASHNNLCNIAAALGVSVSELMR